MQEQKFKETVIGKDEALAEAKRGVSAHTHTYTLSLAYTCTQIPSPIQ